MKKKDPTMQFPLAVKVCQRVVTTLEQMLLDDKEISREHWESILSSARNVVKISDKAPSDSDLIPRLSETVKVKIDPEEPLGRRKEPVTEKEEIARKPKAPRKSSRVTWAIIGICLCVLVVEVWIYVDLKGQRDGIERAKEEMVTAEKTSESARTRVRFPKRVHVGYETEEPAEVSESTGDPESESGNLSVNCMPWCEIHVDGVRLEKTSPMLNHRLPVGEHYVMVVNPPSGLKDSRTIVINTEKGIKLRFALGKEPEVTEEAAPAVTGEGWGRLDVGVTGSWAFVYVDGRKIRTTPILNYKIRSGNHVVELKDGDEQVIRRWRIDLKPNERVKLLHQ